jgi:hypothetical protein
MANASLPSGVIAEHVAAQPRRGQQDPFGLDRTLDQRGRQQGLHVASGARDVVVELRRGLDLLADAELVLQHVAAGVHSAPDREVCVAIDPRAVDERAVRGVEVGHEHLVHHDGDAAMVARDLAVVEHEIGRRHAADDDGLGPELDPRPDVLAGDHRQVVGALIGAFGPDMPVLMRTVVGGSGAMASAPSRAVLWMMVSSALPIALPSSRVMRQPQR